MWATTAQAVEEYWVSLGSYSKLAGAEKMRDRAASTFSQLSIVPSESPMGFVYRVVDGPVADRSIADARLDQARMAGFIDAWVLAQDSAIGLPAAITNSAAAAGDSASEGYSSGYQFQDSASGQVLDAYSDAGSFDQPNTESYDAVDIGKEELVETPPAGYGLHQLQRPSIGVAPGVSRDSRLKELNPDSDED